MLVALRGLCWPRGLQAPSWGWLTAARGSPSAMRRRVLSALALVASLAGLAVAAPAPAAPRPLLLGPGVFAPAGEEILVARWQGAKVRVFAIPVTGGAACPVFSFDVPSG